MSQTILDFRFGIAPAASESLSVFWIDPDHSTERSRSRVRGLRILDLFRLQGTRLEPKNELQNQKSAGQIF